MISIRENFKRLKGLTLVKLQSYSFYRIISHAPEGKHMLALIGSLGSLFIIVGIWGTFQGEAQLTPQRRSAVLSLLTKENGWASEDKVFTQLFPGERSWISHLFFCRLMKSMYADGFITIQRNHEGDSSGVKETYSYHLTTHGRDHYAELRHRNLAPA
jgi:hypothetical protein